MERDSVFAFVDPADVPGYSSPWKELLAGGEHGLLPGTDSRWNWEKRFQKGMEHRPLSSRIKDDIISRSAKGGASQALIDKLVEIWDGRGGIVVTGQQPGLFCGPLYTLYKAQTAIALADALENRFDVPVAPLFWNAGDDDDLQEVRSGGLCFPDWRIVKVEAPANGVDAGRCVGDIPYGMIAPAVETARTILKAWGTRGEAAARALVETDAAMSWGDHFNQLLSLLTGGKILFHDARSVVWREEASELFRSYLERRSAILEALERKNALMRSGGIEPPIRQRTLSVPFTVIEGGVKKKFHSIDADEIRALIDNDPGSLCPNVTLRSPVQDALFPVCASVIGPGELLYLSQISPVYELLGVSEPVRVPRLTMTFVPSSARRIMEETGIGPGELLGGYESIRRKYIKSKMPQDYYNDIDRLSGAFDREARKIFSSFGSDAKLDREIGRIGERIKTLESFGEEATRQRLRKGGEDLQRLSAFCRPPGALQERILSSLFPLYSRGHELLEMIGKAAISHIGRLEKGGSGHILMEIDDSTGESRI